MFLLFRQMTRSHLPECDLYCVGWGVKLYSLTHPSAAKTSHIISFFFCFLGSKQNFTFIFSHPYAHKSLISM